MKLPYLFFLVVSFSAMGAFAQTGNLVGGSAVSGIDMNVFPYGTISTFGLNEKVTRGDSYLYDQWQVGTITTEKGEIKNCPLNIDLKNQIVEINTDQGIKGLPTVKVKRMIVGFPGKGQQVFEPATAYRGSPNQLIGLVEVVVSDQIKLLRHYYSYVKEGAYNAALDMGTNEDKILVRSKYYFYADGTLVEIPSTRKRILKIFPENKQEEVASFIQENHLSLKDQSDLIAVCGFLNAHRIGFGVVD